MERPGSSNSSIHFGKFAVDLRAGELRKEGRRIRLQEQPLQILALLLERQGEAVSRKELRTKLWPTDTFVDFDHGVNSAIARLRGALHDSAERPKYIETVGRRGYRFIGTIEGQVDALPATLGRIAPSFPRRRSVRFRGLALQFTPDGTNSACTPGRASYIPTGPCRVPRVFARRASSGLRKTHRFTGTFWDLHPANRQ